MDSSNSHFSAIAARPTADCIPPPLVLLVSLAPEAPEPLALASCTCACSCCITSATTSYERLSPLKEELLWVRGEAELCAETTGLRLPTT
eukprot:CAMPEP_0173252382 /NCGR_PEP_ID=MMETSP1142-20121109/20698_1 /TAXON_ID=483371 /ORGANISM="non described non described, Strain CCMP2298" /LENGTH=89 /DNA_ID=CAMNT_0014185423 /DNA_START=51 /DNA_END=317 /DNA_ORIENTATION=-